ncbi:hypothetical protein Sjap_018527 [Stephania japonica]|uniref:Uncharacterized protein n=1 Tax=Stephania japonica TaxID=461633 RepID=A0AAP0NJH0_9MAGN
MRLVDSKRRRVPVAVNEESEEVEAVRVRVRESDEIVNEEWRGVTRVERERDHEGEREERSRVLGRKREGKETMSESGRKEGDRETVTWLRYIGEYFGLRESMLSVGFTGFWQLATAVMGGDDRMAVRDSSWWFTRVPKCSEHPNIMA